MTTPSPGDPPRATGREIVTASPLNAETPLSALAEPVTPTSLFYVRNHFDVPPTDLDAWRLELDLAGAGGPRRLTLADLRELPHRSLLVTMECAGNARIALVPRPPGTPWGWGAVSSGRFAGASLRDLLARFGVRDDAVELLFTGADRGTTDAGTDTSYERSLPLDVAHDPDILLAWELNGAPLLPEHGAPLRLVVPRWYGMASVKWLARITALTRPFTGFFQATHYVYRGAKGVDDGTPVTRMRVRSLIAHPQDGAELPIDDIEIRGGAWSGEASIREVHVSVDGGRTWSDAECGQRHSDFAATTWRYRWRPRDPGEYELVARATDASGAEQPLTGEWNALGYGNNVVHRIRVRVGRSR